MCLYVFLHQIFAIFLGLGSFKIRFMLPEHKSSYVVGGGGEVSHMNYRDSERKVGLKFMDS